MDPTSPQESIFYDALQLADAAARDEYLSAACGADVKLRQRVEALLSAYAVGDFLEVPAPELGATQAFAPINESAGDMIGPYKLLEQIGEGGMGLVYMAEQSQPIRRRVALKIIKPGLDTRSVIARFEAERQALALMEHPNIAHVYDSGATASGRPYFAMELVRGSPITDYCRERGLDLRERLRLFIEVCQAVQHAHQKGIIHRDLKPTNILVRQNDTIPVPKIIDFGIAKATASQPLTDKTLFTAFSQIVGTPLYMSPEQADLGNQDIDTRSDVYSLGVVLYELLTGTTPFDADRLSKAGPDEMRRIIREEEPQKPSTRATTIAAAADTKTTSPLTDPAVAVWYLRGDLDWIVMKALEKDRSRRYESANSLAVDLNRYLNSEPVSAGPPSAFYQFGKFARRQRGLLVVIGVIALTLVSGTAVSLWQLREANKAKSIADERAVNEGIARRRAESNLRRGSEAVEILLSRFAEEHLLDQPHMEDLRRTLLTEALRLNNALLSENSGDKQAQIDAAQAYRRMAEIQDYLGNISQSAEAARNAIGLLEPLTVADPENAELLRELAKSYLVLSFALFNGEPGRPNESPGVYERLLSLNEKLLQRTPDDAKVMFAVGQACDLVATVIQSDNPERSQSLFQRSLEIGGRILRIQPRQQAYVDFHARTHWFYGRAFQNCRDYPSAKREYLAAISVLDRLPADTPLSSTLRKSRVEFLTSLANLSGSSVSPQEGADYARQAKTLAEQLIADYPVSFKFQKALFDARTVLASSLEKDGQFDAAAAEHHYLIDNADKLGPEWSRQRRDSSLVALTQISLQKGDYISAGNSLTALAELNPASWQEQCQVAFYLSHCAQLAKHDTTTAKEDRLRISDNYMRLARDEVDLDAIANVYERKSQSDVLMPLATLQAWFRADTDYTATSRQALRIAATSKDPQTFERTAKICCLLPLLEPSELESARLFARQGADLAKHSALPPYYLVALGMTEYRCGDYERAMERLLQAVQSPPDCFNLLIAECFRAMCLHRLDRHAEAKQVLSEIHRLLLVPPQDANRWWGLEPSHDLLIVWMSFNEAAELIGLHTQPGELINETAVGQDRN
ncbi:MAG: serine/threonine-protein kinase [Pirellulales bacterium]